MTKYIKVKDHNNLARDISSNGIVNTDYESYQAYVNSYENKKNQLKKDTQLESELKELKNEINEIKALLQKLIIS